MSHTTSAIGHVEPLPPSVLFGHDPHWISSGGALATSPHDSDHEPDHDHPHDEWVPEHPNWPSTTEHTGTSTIDERSILMPTLLLALDVHHDKHDSGHDHDHDDHGHDQDHHGDDHHHDHGEQGHHDPHHETDHAHGDEHGHKTTHGAQHLYASPEKWHFEWTPYSAGTLAGRGLGIAPNLGA